MANVYVEIKVKNNVNKPIKKMKRSLSRLILINRLKQVFS